MNTAELICDELRSHNPALPAQVYDAALRRDGWQPTGHAPTDGREIVVRTEQRYRYAAYEANSTHAKRGLTGRWQRLNERGTWETVPAPTGLWRAA